MLKTKLDTETDSIVVQLLFEIWALCGCVSYTVLSVLTQTEAKTWLLTQSVFEP